MPHKAHRCQISPMKNPPTSVGRSTPIGCNFLDRGSNFLDNPAIHARTLARRAIAYPRATNRHRADAGHDLALCCARPTPPRGGPLDFPDTPKALVVVDVARRRIDGRRPPPPPVRGQTSTRGCSTSARPTRSPAVSSHSAWVTATPSRRSAFTDAGAPLQPLARAARHPKFPSLCCGRARMLRHRPDRLHQ
jgi:hypothetical protein